MNIAYLESSEYSSGSELGVSEDKPYLTIYMQQFYLEVYYATTFFMLIHRARAKSMQFSYQNRSP